MLEIRDLCFGYSDDLIIDHLSMSVSFGEIVALIGESGSGKTTLFQLITGLRTAQHGSIDIDGDVSYMMQDDLLLGWRTVLDNIMLADELEKITASKQKALELLGDVGLAGYAKYYPDELSGGMRQRVALARSLMFSRPLLLLDEPFGAIDHTKRQELYLLVRRLQKKYGLTILFITHQIDDAKALADRIFFLESGRVFESEVALC
ncbi:MAG: ATP-binding cassette domain-containing protein [Simkaniaceae bacterium]|nr:ATP-binding cassette domain-containing protein [Simkaniaceae bacterium]